MKSSHSSAPQIGFDRFIELDWIAAALHVRSDLETMEGLERLLEKAGMGAEARIKTRTKLNALVLAPRVDLIDFIDRGALTVSRDNYSSLALSRFAWGAALATYPYFGKVSEIMGRLTNMQGQCSVAEVHRRMGEFYGDREIVKRATQAVLQSQVNWGVVERVEKGRRLVRKMGEPVRDETTAGWLVEAALRYHGRALPVATIYGTAVLYPFELIPPVATIAGPLGQLEIRSEGVTQQVVALRSGS